MSRTIRKSQDSGTKAKKSYKRQRSLAQQFLDEYMEKNNKSEGLELYSL